MTRPFLFDVLSWDDWRDGLGDHGWNLLLIVLLLGAVNILFRRVISGIFRAALRRSTVSRREDPVAIQRRADTLSSTLNWAFGGFLLFLGAGLLLDELGVSITTLIAGVGVVGIAVGLGAQALVRDVINGIFILIEDQYRVGDVVTVAGVTGTVVEINPRRTVLRDFDGSVHSIPNSAISVATNQTQGFSRISLDIPLTYDTDTSRAMALIDEVGAGLAAERPAEFTSGPPRALRIQGMQEHWLTIRVGADVRPGAQWDLSGELRARIKQRFDAEGIHLVPAARWRPEEPAEAHQPPPP
jgi:moderate conductance mechanosensitive channel